MPWPVGALALNGRERDAGAPAGLQKLADCIDQGLGAAVLYSDRLQELQGARGSAQQDPVVSRNEAIGAYVFAVVVPGSEARYEVRYFEKAAWGSNIVQGG